MALPPTAVEMAMGGFTSAADAIGGDIGFLNAYGDSIDMAPLKALGCPWAYLSPGMWIKPYPSGNLTHPGMSRIDEFLEKNNALRKDVCKLDIQTKQSIYDTLIHHHPKTGLQSKFSMEFCIVKILIDGDLGLSDFSDEVVQRPDIQHMLGNTNYSAFPDAESKDLGYENYTTLITFTLKDGRTFTERSDFGKGSAHDPFSYDETAEKAQRCCTHRDWPQKKFELLVEGWKQIDTVPDVNEITQNLFI